MSTDFNLDEKIEDAQTPVEAHDDLEERFLKKREELEVDKYFRALVKLEGSDLHMKVGRPPIVRVHGTLKELNRPPIEAEEMVGSVRWLNQWRP